jgi:hypothetical protein
VIDVAVGFFSLTGGAEGGDDAAYLRWHLLDHEPEQHAIAGLRASTRWIADDDCLAARLFASDALEPARHAVQYLFAEPAEPSLEEFVALAARLRAEGRFPHRARSLLLGAYDATAAGAAPRAVVSAAALPHRAHRGVVLVVESAAEAPDLGSLLEIEGVAGACAYAAGDRLGRGPDQGRRFGLPAWDPQDRTITVVYVEGDLRTTTAALRGPLERRWSADRAIPELAVPLRSMQRHLAWPEV